MRKIKKIKNIYKKNVNNLLDKIFHILYFKHHIVSKDYLAFMQELGPIYHELNRDFERIDVIDLIYYERWLNG